MKNNDFIQSMEHIATLADVQEYGSEDDESVQEEPKLDQSKYAESQM
jgi:hypothetical protein